MRLSFAHSFQASYCNIHDFENTKVQEKDRELSVEQMNLNSLGIIKVAKLFTNFAKETMQNLFNFTLVNSQNCGDVYFYNSTTLPGKFT